MLFSQRRGLRIFPFFLNGIIRAFKFLCNRLFITSMQLPRKRGVPSSTISKMSRSLPRRCENNMRYSTLAEQLNACDGCDSPLNLMNIEQERLHGFGSYVSISCTTIAVLFHLFHPIISSRVCVCLVYLCLTNIPIQLFQVLWTFFSDGVFLLFWLHDVLPIKIHCRVIWRRNWRCPGLSWKMHGFCSVAKIQAHVSQTRANVLAQCSLDLTVYHNRHTRLIALLVFLVQLFVSHPTSIYISL
jgi:hypothetical protein